MATKVNYTGIALHRELKKSTIHQVLIADEIINVTKTRGLYQISLDKKYILGETPYIFESTNIREVAKELNRKITEIENENLTWLFEN